MKPPLRPLPPPIHDCAYGAPDLFVFNDTIEEVHRRRNTPVRRCLPNPRTELSPCSYIIQFYFFQMIYFSGRLSITGSSHHSYHYKLD